MPGFLRLLEFIDIGNKVSECIAFANFRTPNNKVRVYFMFSVFSNTYEGTQYCGCTTKLTILSIFSTFPGYFELVQFPYKNVTWDFIAQLVGSRNSTIKVLRGTDIHYLSPQNI